MGETSLKFGPEWLRKISQASSPPSSPYPGKFKLAENRFGREDMLALCVNDVPPPDDYERIGSLYISNVQQPLNLTSLNAEEQRMFARVNSSEAVLRGTGRPPINGVGRGRGGPVERGRGRARGSISAPYYNRGISYDEEQEVRGHIRDAGPPGLNGRGKVYERQPIVTEPRGWNERGVPERGINSSLDETAIGMVSPRKEPNRANNQNWRSRAITEGGGDRWSGLSSNRNEKWGPRTTWRERESGTEGEWEDIKNPHPGSGYPRGGRTAWDGEREKDMLRRQYEEDNLPEWANSSIDDKGGSFDSAGAFHAPGYSDDEVGDPVNIQIIHPPSRPEEDKEEILPNVQFAEENVYTNIKSKFNKETKQKIDNYGTDVDIEHQTMKNYPLLSNGVLSVREQSEFVRNHKPDRFNSQKQVVKREKEVEDLEHMQIVADDLVAKLVGDDEPKLVNSNIKMHPSNVPPPAGFNCHNNQLAPEDQWFYTDPQGEIQGPFSSDDMTAWFEVGYFKSNLLLRRQCDDKFAQLGDLMRVFGRMPFLPGPAVPPLKVSELLAQKALAHQERFDLLQAYQMKTQLFQQQETMRQHQALQQLQNLDEWNSLSNNQQQQLFMQHMMSLPPLQPPAIPSALQDLVPPASTTSITTIPPNLLSAKPTRSNMGISPVTTPDPIQSLMAQMQTHSAAPISSSTLDVQVQIPAPSTCVASEGPLQKLLSQLQRGSSASLPSVATITHTVTKPPSLQQPVEQTDPIKAFLNQMSKVPASPIDAAQEEHKRREEEKRIEEREIYEQQKRQNEEILKQEEIRYLEKLQEKRRLQILEEEKLQMEREIKLQQELEEKNKIEQWERQMEQNRLAEEAAKVEEARREQKLKRKQEEEVRKREEVKKKEEIKRKEEEKRKEEDKRKKEEKKQEEERKKKERQAQNQEQLRKIALEEERKRMNKVEAAAKKNDEDQKRKNVKQTHAAWNSKTVHEAVAPPSLLAIQKAQEIKEKEKEDESKDQKRLKEAARKAREDIKKKEQIQGWAGAVQPNKRQHSQLPVKSLLEIQQEEEKELQKRLKKEQAERATSVNHISLNAAGVWGSAAQSLSWASRASSAVGGNNILQPVNSLQSQATNSGGWASIAQGSNVVHATINGDTSGGFWDNPVGKSSKSQSTANVSVQVKNVPQLLLKQNMAVNNKGTKKKNKDDNVKKIFSNHSKCDDGFGGWCSSALSTMKVNINIDIPTFVGFLADVDSPYDVHDYIRNYLGDSKEVRTFARDYLDKRSTAKNALKQNRSDDDILAPAPAVNPTNIQEFQEIKTKVKKSKKKMQRLDNNLLGFTLSATEQPTE